ncbi:GroES-like protein [Agrocybe pediades]|nr:GroES-like protein [Agrocybe pediades]
MSPATRSQKHLALVLEGPDGPFTLKELPTPTPKKGEVLVKVQSCGLNPADWKIPKYKIILTEFPGVLGFDIAGELVEVGEDVSNYEAGDRVFFQSQSYIEGGGFQQYSIAQASLVSKIPESLSYDEASTLPVLIGTAYSGLYAEFPYGLGLVPPITDEGYGKYKDTPIFVTGGASTIGQGAIQFAKISGFSPIITTASLKNEEALKKAGATHVVDRSLSNDDIIAEIAKITAGKQVQHVYDSVGSDITQKLSVDLLSQSGSGGTVAFGLPWLTVSEADYPSVKMAKIAASPHLPQNFELFKSLYTSNKLSTWIKEGLIIPNRFEVLPGGLNGVGGGLKRLEADEVSRLKLVVHPQETSL